LFELTLFFVSSTQETSSQRVQRVDYNRLKREHAQEPITNSIRPQLQDYTFHNQSETTTQG